MNSEGFSLKILKGRRKKVKNHRSFLWLFLFGSSLVPCWLKRSDEHAANSDINTQGIAIITYMRSSSIPAEWREVHSPRFPMKTRCGACKIPKGSSILIYRRVCSQLWKSYFREYWNTWNSEKPKLEQPRSTTGKTIFLWKVYQVRNLCRCLQCC